MASILKRFNKQVVGSDGRIFDYLSKITAYGDFQRIQDLSVIISSWNNILITRRRTYLHDPEYGSDVYLLLFEPADSDTVDKIKTEIKRSLSRYDGRANIDSIDVFLKSGNKGYQVNVHVNYEGTKGTLSVSFSDTTITSQSTTTTGT